MSSSFLKIRGSYSWIYLTGFSILVISRFIGTTALLIFLAYKFIARMDFWLIVVSNIGCAFMLLYTLLAKAYKGHEAAAALLVLLFAARVAAVSQEYYILWIAIAIVCARGIDFDDVAWTHVCVCIAFSLVVFAMSQMQIIPSYTELRGDQIRYALGMRHPNYLGGHILFAALAVAYLRRNRLNAFDAAAAGFLAIFCNEVPMSRTSAISLFTLCAGIIVVYAYRQISHGRSGRIPRWTALLLTAVPLACAIFSIAFTCKYNSANPLYAKIDGLLSGRLYNGQVALNYYHNFSLFGQRALLYPAESPIGYISVDNFYVRCLILFGPIVLAASLVMLTAVDARAMRRESYFTVFLIAIVATYCICEAYMLRVEFNFFVVALLATCNRDASGALYIPKKVLAVLGSIENMSETGQSNDRAME